MRRESALANKKKKIWQRSAFLGVFRAFNPYNYGSIGEEGLRYRWFLHGLRDGRVSPSSFRLIKDELLRLDLIKITNTKNSKRIKLTEKGEKIDSILESLIRTLNVKTKCKHFEGFGFGGDIDCRLLGEVFYFKCNDLCEHFDPRRDD